jgi:hypothetical protein
MTAPCSLVVSRQVANPPSRMQYINNRRPMGGGYSRLAARLQLGAGVAEKLSYKEHRLLVSPQGPGWKVIIYPPGAMLAINEIPYTGNPAGQDQVIAAWPCRRRAAIAASRDGSVATWAAPAVASLAGATSRSTRPRSWRASSNSSVTDRDPVSCRHGANALPAGPAEVPAGWSSRLSAALAARLL